MKIRTAVAAIAILSIGLLVGANVQPILTGAGYVVFPEAVVSASIHATSGKLSVSAGGTNQPVELAPTGTGGAKTTGICNTAGCLVTIGGVQTLTNKTIDYLSNTITNLPATGFSSFSLTAIAVSTVYQNTSGHTQYIQVPGSVSGVGLVALAYCDSSNPPTSVASIFSDTAAGVQYGTLSFMVLANYYWRIDAGVSLYDSKARVWQ